jgi:hypothetical protein
MHPKRYAFIAGIIFLALGILSFIPGLSQDPYQDSSATLPPLELQSSYGLFLGLFAMNIVNKIVLLAFGIGGIAASQMSGRELPASIFYAKTVLVVMGIGAILGMIPATQTFFGYWPLFGNEVWLHGVSALIGGYFGFMLPHRAHVQLNRHSVQHP